MSELQEEVRVAPILAISIDESAAIDHSEYLSIEIYYPDKHGMAKNAFLALQKVERMDAEAISSNLVGKRL